MTPDGSHWVPRQPAGSWLDSHYDSNMSHQGQRYPLYTTQERPGGRIQYSPYEYPHITPISSALGGNSLTDADKIRHIRKELPSVRVSEPASDDSAFLPPHPGPSVAGKLGNDSNLTSSSKFDNDNTRWHSNLHKKNIDNIPATDQNCNNRYRKIHHGPPASSAFHAPKSSPGSRCSSEQGFSETITQVKQITPDSEPDNNMNTKRRVSETIFCLVSVPVHTHTKFNKYASADQNNNDTRTCLTIPNTFAVGLKERRPVRSKSVNQEPIWSNYSQFHTSSTTSLRNYKRAPLRKEIIDAWALQANVDREMCYSWPGNQYRNQETQTGSPVTVVKSPEPQTPEEKYISVDSGGRADSCSSYGYPIEGQKNLHPSSNSAFSILSPSQALSAETLPPEPAPLLTHLNRGDQRPSPRKKMSSPLDSSPDNPTESTEQVVFGQFLLKQVNRRPCDAIGELESINKEMENTISKRPNVGQSGVNKRHNCLKSGVHSVEELIIPPMHAEKPSNIKVRAKSFTSNADVDTIEISSCFTRDSRPSTQADSRDNYLTSVSQDSAQTHQDIPVPQESLLRDVGLTVYTETYGGPKELVQRSCSGPPPEQSVELTWESRTKTSKNRESLKHNLNEQFKADQKPHLSGVSVRICRSRSESSRSSHKRECSPHVIKLNREVSCLFDNDDHKNEPLAPTNVSTIADKHLEILLIQEKANSLTAEDLSILYEVKCAKGIPENEPIEERAARILNIAVPVESLGEVDKQKDYNLDNVGTEQEEFVEVKKESLVQEEEKVKKVDHGDSHKQSSIHSTNLQQTEDNAFVAIGLTEIPNRKFSLCLPVIQNQDLMLTMYSGGNTEPRTACKLMADNDSSSAVCLATNQTTQLKELDTATGISPASPLGSGSRELSSVKDGQSTEFQEEAHIRGGVYDNSGKEEETPYKKHPVHGKPEEDRNFKEVDVQECKHSQGVEHGNVKIQTDDKGIQEVAEFRSEDPEELRLKAAEDSKEEFAKMTRGGTGGGHNMGEVSHFESAAQVAAAPKLKQRTQLQKPPLLPKPRSVPKREITLPCSFSTGTLGAANMEDKDTITISGECSTQQRKSYK